MEQAQLFKIAPPDNAAEVPGLTLTADYITQREESDLLAAVEHGPWEMTGVGAFNNTASATRIPEANLHGSATSQTG